MTSPWHQHASVPVHGTPDAIHQRLTADPAAEVATATAAALARLEPLVRSWGLAPAALPTVTAHRTDDPDEVGAVQLRWSGDEDATAWPSLTARILVVPDAADQARLALLTPRSPRAELATRRLGRVHRERVVDVAVQRFLLELADRLADPETGRPVGSPLTRFDRRPVFVHQARTLDTDPQTLVGELLGDLQGLATDTTAHALAASHATLAAGRFRRPPAPAVQVAPTPPGTLGVVDLAWTSDEEATGWPQIGVTLAVEAAAGGSRLVVLSRRVPGYDLSSNRVDKHQRDQILRELGRHVADATVRRLPTPHGAPRPQPVTAAA